MELKPHTLVFASANAHKVEEVNGKLPWTIIGLEEINCHDDIPETAPDLRGNAAQKARFIYEKYGVDCFADDTGLEIDALDGKPGVFSARYAGPQKNPLDNREKVLQEMQTALHRSARFKTVICCILKGEEFFFEGIAEGNITREPRGTAGFGYDPIFVPFGNSRTFAQMSLEEKNIISHRGKAIAQLSAFLKSR